MSWGFLIAPLGHPQDIDCRFSLLLITYNGVKHERV